MHHIPLLFDANILPIEGQLHIRSNQNSVFTPLMMTAPDRVVSLTTLAAGPTRTLSPISFTNVGGVEEKRRYLQAYCIDPPEDHCSLGVCPNPDVTGLGQQISGQFAKTIKPNAKILTFNIVHQSTSQQLHLVSLHPRSAAALGPG
jgi:hypothetical protein